MNKIQEEELKLKQQKDSKEERADAHKKQLNYAKYVMQVHKPQVMRRSPEPMDVKMSNRTNNSQHMY